MAFTLKISIFIKRLPYLSRILGAEELVPSSVEDDLRSRTKEAFEPRLKIKTQPLKLSKQQLIKQLATMSTVLKGAMPGVKFVIRNPS